MAKHIKILWKDKGILVTYENRAKFQLPDSANYWFEKIDDIAVDEYLPSEQVFVFFLMSFFSFFLVGGFGGKCVLVMVGIKRGSFYSGGGMVN